MRGLDPAGEPAEVHTYTVETGTSGTFLIKGVTAGRYELVAQHELFGADGQHQEASVQLTLKPGQHYSEVSLKLSPLGAIFGTVLDEDGTALRSMTVEALSYSGTRTEGKAPTVLRSAWTDDRGNYRIFGLPKGPYYVRVTGCGCAVAPRRRVEILGKKLEKSYNDTYFPSANDLTQAATVILPAAGEVRADVRLTSVSARYSISGVIAGTQSTPGALWIIISSTGGAATSLKGKYGGEFLYRDAAPGTYVVRAVDRERGLSARRVVRLTNSDAHITLTLRPEVVLSGKILVEGSQTISADRVRLTLTSDEQLSTSSIVPGHDGAFAFRALEPGAHVVAVTIPEGGYLKGIRFNGKLLTRPVIELSDSSDTLAIVIAADGGELSGNIVTPDGSRIGEGAAALVGAGASNGVVSRVVAIDEQGQFEFRDVPPGDYQLYCLKGITPQKALDPQLKLRDEDVCKAIHVSASSRQHALITLAPLNHDLQKQPSGLQIVK